MPESFKLIKQLIDYIEDYDEQIGNNDLKEFSFYLCDKLTNPASNKQIDFDKSNYQNYKSYKEVEFSALLTNLYRFAKHYTKKAFLETEINTIEEFGFLASLLKNKSMLKNELITSHLLETSSGSEILKRLIKKGLVDEIPDSEDKRARRVSLTKKGTKTIFEAFDDMHKVSEIIIGNLTEKEITQALKIFNKLNYFHHQVYKTDKKTDLSEVHRTYISQ